MGRALYVHFLMKTKYNEAAQGEPQDTDNGFGKYY